MNINNFCKADNYILKVETDKNGASIKEVKKSLFTWFAVKVLKLEKYKLTTVIDQLSKRPIAFENKEQQSLFYAKLSQKINHYDAKRPTNPPLIEKIKQLEVNQSPASSQPVVKFAANVEQGAPVNIAPSHQIFKIIDKQTELTQSLIECPPIKICPLACAYTYFDMGGATPQDKEEFKAIKEKLEQDGHVRFKYNEEECSFEFFHHEKEVAAIIQKHDLKNVSSNLSPSRLALTMNGETFIANNNFELHQTAQAAYLKSSEEFLKTKQAQTIQIDAAEHLNSLSLMTDLLKIHHGIVIGERHTESLARKQIIDNLSKLEVKTLYLEHLFYDSMQPLLDAYLSSDDEEMPSYLAQYLKDLDDSQNNWATNQKPNDPHYKYTALVKAAKQAKVRIVAIDTTLSYRCGTTDKEGVINSKARCQGMNAIASLIIEENQAVNPGKYIALMGSRHVATTKTEQVIGVAEYLGVPSLVYEQNSKSDFKIEYNKVMVYEEIVQLGAFIVAP